MMTASDTLINSIKRFEGLRLKAYQDAKGVWTIGYGHTSDVRPGDVISPKEAEALLRADLRRFEDYVNSLDVCREDQGRFDALTDFAYNCGTEYLRKSTLLRLIRENRDEEEIRKEFLRWVYSGGKKLNGLIKRRKWEADRFFNKNSYSFWDELIGRLKVWLNRICNK